MITRFTAPARRQADRIDRWWRANRPDSADLFTRELEAAELLIATPGSGTRYVERRGIVIWRMLLQKTRNHVYFRVDRVAGVVMIVAVWGAPKARGPKL